MKFILGVVAGAIAYWLYQSRGQQGLSSEPEFLQRARESVTSVATAGAQRTVEAFDSVHTQSSRRSMSSQAPDSAISDGQSAAAQAQRMEGDPSPETAPQ